LTNLNWLVDKASAGRTRCSGWSKRFSGERERESTKRKAH
jgi:hypothetical protein